MSEHHEVNLTPAQRQAKRLQDLSLKVAGLELEVAAIRRGLARRDHPASCHDPAAVHPGLRPTREER